MVFFRKKGTAATGMRTHVLVQVDDFVSGGLETVVQDINRVLLGEGLTVTLLVLGQTGPALDVARRSGVKLVQIPRQERSYRRLLRKLDPDVVLAHYSTYGAAVCRKAQIPFVQVVHNMYCWFDQAAVDTFDQAVASTSLFVAVSEAVRDYTLARFDVPPAQCIVIPNGIDVARFALRDPALVREAIRTQYGFAGDDIVLLAAGAINAQKNTLALVRAVGALQAECPNMKLLIAGRAADSVLAQELQQYIAGKGLQDVVVWVGAVDTMPELYAAADVYVSASRFEGGQLSLLEALAANKMIVTTAVGFARHISDQRGCTVVPFVDDILVSKNLQAALQQICNDPATPDIRDEVLQAMDIPRAYQPYVRLIQQLSDTGTCDTAAIPPGWPGFF